MKALIVRLSSFGDILQTLPTIDSLTAAGAEVSYLTKKTFIPLMKNHPHLHSVIELEGRGSLIDIFNTAKKINKENFTHIYDAHNNLRSFWLKLFLFFLSLPKGKLCSFITRPKNRWKRYLFFKWRKSVFKTPFYGTESYLEPLLPWNARQEQKNKRHLYFSSNTSVQLPQKPFIALAPSAAWATKRWPEKHWIELIQSQPQTLFVLLGGSDDSFCETIHQASPHHTINMAGKLNLIESCFVVDKSELLISGDTGMLHAADQLNKKCIALIGPTAFGYPFNTNSHVLETHMSCKPCSKDGSTKCKNSVYQRCMLDIRPQMVLKKMLSLMETAH